MVKDIRMQRTVVTINSNGRQSASFIRVAAALGWQVRAQMRDLNGIVARELSELENVTVYIGALEDKRFLDDLFKSAQCAFINTTHWGDEVAIGRSLADAAKKAGIQHYIYSSMPDHSVFGNKSSSISAKLVCQRPSFTAAFTTTTLPVLTSRYFAWNISTMEVSSGRHHSTQISHSRG
jgi:hypothetical protein